VALETRILACIANSHARIDWYAGELAKLGWPLAETILPHDAGNDSVQTSKSVATLLREAGMPRVRVLPREDIEPGIAAARRLLPSCVFDAQRCERGLEALRQYRRKWDERNQVFQPNPLHDWCSDYADAFRYLAVGLRQAAAIARPRMQTVTPGWSPYAERPPLSPRQAEWSPYA
jgi:hypothetical protein